MEFTREIYWNVGRSVVLPMYILSFLVLVFLGYSLFTRIKIYRRGKAHCRNDQPAKRVLNLLKNLLFQSRLLKELWPGAFHALFFWSFLILLLGTTLVFVQADFSDPLFGVRFLTGSFYLLFSLALDLAGLIALGGVIILILSNFQKAKGLAGGDLFAFFLLVGVLVTGFLVEGIRLAATELVHNPELAAYSPVGGAVASLFVGMEEERLLTLHLYSWWVHFALTMGFFVSIPLTRLKHLFLGPANYFFKDLHRPGTLSTPDLEDDSIESFGAGKVRELSWKDIFDSDVCVECERCQKHCPAHSVGKTLSPMKLMKGLREASFDPKECSLFENISKEELWACTTCRACEESCPLSIEHLSKIVEMRRHLALMEGEFPGDEVKRAMDNCEINGNPLGIAFASRGDWAEGLSIAEEPGEILFFAGCYGSFDERNKKVARSFMKLCESARINVTILGKEEKCCGEPLRKMGNEYLYQMMAAENIEKMKASGAKKIVTTCPHCFHSLKNDYPALGLDMEVEHYILFLHRLLKEGRLSLYRKNFDCTYHDSCLLGRYHHIYSEPRELIERAGGVIEEMEKNRSESFCCGAGGGRILAEEDSRHSVVGEKVLMASRTGRGRVVSSCPFCLTMMEDGFKTAGVSMEVKDIVEILEERLGE